MRVRVTGEEGGDATGTVIERLNPTDKVGDLWLVQMDSTRELYSLAGLNLLPLGA